MSSASDLRRLREAANRIRTDIARSSTVVATKRKKATEAQAAAGKSKSASTIRSKLSEAERATKEANTAESKRAELEKKLAEAEVKVSKAQQKYEQDRSNAQTKALTDLRRTAQKSSEQFAPRQLASSFGERTSALSGSEPVRNSSITDVFLSHASEDKDEIARPLRESLEARGVTVWFDELKIKVGQSIRQEIEAGIAGCRFGVVIVSPNFFAKQWTQAELDALFGKKMDSGENLVLPIWHHISKDEVQRHSPLLAGLLALNTAVSTIDEIADSLVEVVHAER
ncbi:hypothetical protein BA895_11000 [Humibacillus sp. DSM 29435]|uniref:toll/interleukin-1 receptor domain-containing protein n=1 Tax=Humibacillus sp. DSM 29435 TaxID=1869167 RepID=UPI0008728C13|nr:toll/interleukin-1 receptor domain-containing protein [Humibacillus sp. DSM 29435]OFE14470.1 hypothetical protein BA895_11000 [Humibacillus sp. DSM 29435]